jgi:hypothetical protein
MQNYEGLIKVSTKQKIVHHTDLLITFCALEQWLLKDNFKAKGR